ncbi:MAG TPA: hypothetical protein VJQ52_23935 [Steroidobacteraceae bacterium]|nr:hypothetical protein [Steroidobacteraceae bacterium]
MTVRFPGVIATLLLLAQIVTANAQSTAGGCPDERKLQELARRVKDLETRAYQGRLGGSKVVAPFEVTNEAGTRIFRVEDGYVWFYNSTGATSARVVMQDKGGYFIASSTTAKLTATIGAVGTQANVFVMENDQHRINLGRNDKGRFGLRVYEPGGKIVAGIGQGNGNDGVVTIGDAQGSQRAVMFVSQGGGGILQVLNKAGNSVGSLYATDAGNGRMELFNDAGLVMVQAGVNEHNIGMVRAGPAGFHPGVGILGLPGSYIAGKAEQ